MNRIFLLEQKEGYSEALEIAFALLAQIEGSNEHLRVSDVLNEIAYIYYNFNKMDKALHFYQRAHERVLKANSVLDEGISYTNLYGIYAAMGDSKTAIKYCVSAIACFKKINYIKGLQAAYGNMAIYYKDINIDQALSYALQSQRLRTDSIDATNPGLDEIILANIYLRKAQSMSGAKKKEWLSQARLCFEKAERLGRSLNLKGLLRSAALGYSDIERERGDHKKAYELLRLYQAYNDSLVGGSEDVSLRTMIKYEFEKKEQVRLMEAQKKEAEEQKAYERQKLFKNFFIIGFALFVVVSLFMFRGYRTIRNAYQIISQQKSDADVQKRVIENKQELLLNSIAYAQRIQASLLKSEEDLRKLFPESFVLYLPRDIVSGDFYWFTRTQSGETVVVLADCTGHGVPGALLSMIGITALNEIVNHQNITEPAEIVRKLSLALKDAFMQQENITATDGMDISVCRLDPKKEKLRAVCINQNLYVMNASGGLMRSEVHLNSANGLFDVNDKEVLTHSDFDIREKTLFFLASDGLTDQLGEGANKKFMSARLEELLIKNSGQGAANLKSSILKDLYSWRGKLAQTDDISAVGFIC